LKHFSSPSFKLLISNNFYFTFIIVVFFLISYVAISAVDSVPFISKKKELEIGRSGDKQIILQYGIYQDTSLQLYVNKIGQKLVSKLTNKEFRKFYFKLVDSSTINAFALPGGYIYVTRGLLAALNSESELAAVLGHEIAHVTLHHGAKLVIRSIGSQLLTIGGAIVSPENASKWLAISSTLFQQINLGYGREAEIESDSQGMMNSVEAGYNPIAMINFLNNLRKQEIMSGQAYHGFQASHPETKERIVKASLLASSLSRKYFTAKRNQNDYLRKLKGLVYGGKKHVNDRVKYKPRYLDIYKVQKGDTFQSISQKFYQNDRDDYEITTINGFKVSDALKPGLMLKIIRDGFKLDVSKDLKLDLVN
jgi:predicted Zn-dependent protease